MRVSQHTALDCGYNEFIPQLYKDQLKTVKLKVPCLSGHDSGSNKVVLCARPAEITIELVESKIDTNILQQIKSNRTEYDGLITRCFGSLPQQLCSASVFIEHVTK